MAARPDTMRWPVEVVWDQPDRVYFCSCAGLAAREPDLALAVRQALQHGGAGYLLGAFPPDAAGLERAGYQGSLGEALAAEEAALEWLRLLPALALAGDGERPPLLALAPALCQVGCHAPQGSTAPHLPRP